MTDTFGVPLGTPSKLAYLIRMEEDTWLRWPEGDREAAKELWLEEAKRHVTEGGADLRIVCLQLIPDPLFPSTAKTTPYVEWQVLLRKPDEEDFRTLVTIELNPERVTSLTPQLRIRISGELGKHPLGTPYKIISGEAVLDHGRIA